MPWKVVKKSDNRYCVHKLDAEGTPVSDPVACHDSEEEAMSQMRALYASEHEGKSAVKFAPGSETDISGLLAPNYGPFAGKDISGEFFSPQTDFALSWFAPDARPILYQHALDAKVGASVVGRMKAVSQDDLGLWMKGQLDASHEYYEAIRELVKQGKLGLSSGSMRHLVEVNAKTGEIKKWPLIEGSLTPTPCNPMATVDFAAAKSHFKSIGVEIPDAIKAELDAESREQLDDKDFAYIDSQGGRHLPIHDKKHIQNAMARFNQTHFESEEAKEKAKKKMLAAARRMGMEVSEDSKAVTITAGTLSTTGRLTTAGTTASGWGNYAIVGGDFKILTNADMPDHEEHHDKPVEREPAMKTPMMMMRKMAEEMGMHPSEEEMQAMMAEMGDMAGMSEAEMQQKMRQVLAKHKSAPDLVALVGRLADEGIEGGNLDTLPLATHAEAVKILTGSLLERTKDLRERRIKEGRQISQPNRERLQAANEALKTATGEMATFLDSTEPAKAAVVRLQFEMLKLYSATI